MKLIVLLISIALATINAETTDEAEDSEDKGLLGNLLRQDEKARSSKALSRSAGIHPKLQLLKNDDATDDASVLDDDLDTSDGNITATARLFPDEQPESKASRGFGRERERNGKGRREWERRHQDGDNRHHDNDSSMKYNSDSRNMNQGLTDDQSTHNRAAMTRKKSEGPIQRKSLALSTLSSILSGIRSIIDMLIRKLSGSSWEVVSKTALPLIDGILNKIMKFASSSGKSQ